MKTKKIIAFYDMLLFIICCAPFSVSSIFIFIYGKLYDSHWIVNYWYLVLLYAVGVVLPFSCRAMLRYTEFNSTQSVFFYYFPFTISWNKAGNNIDCLWNQHVLISEIKDIEIISLTEEDKQTKVFYKHWFNKYLKINLNHEKSKYVYVGNYSKRQIKKIITFLTKQSEN